MLSFASIPIVASLIGYGTNVLAIHMTFLPLEYIGWFESTFRATGFSLGCKMAIEPPPARCAASLARCHVLPLAWVPLACAGQGIIPANCEKIAEKAVTIITTRLVTVEEVFARLDKKKIVELTREPLLKTMERVRVPLAAARLDAPRLGGTLSLAAEIARSLRLP